MKIVRDCIGIALLVLAGSAAAAVKTVDSVGLTVGDLAGARRFYTEVLPFNIVGEVVIRGEVSNDLFAVEASELSAIRLRLGDEFITLNRHLGIGARPIPTDSRSHDHWFQHIAIVVSDLDRAYAHLRRHNVKHVSTAPQTLPAWNKEAGGIRAFYFRDPEDHVLEIIWFPPGKGDPRWQRPASGLFLGIDHTAIVVGDTDRSLAFYTNRLGFRVVGSAENHGTEQEHLNQVFGARLRITALRASQGPGIEFLEYIAPPGGRPYPADVRGNDLVFWTTQLTFADVRGAAAGIDSGYRSVGDQGTRTRQPRRIANPGRPDSLDIIVRDPDGHALRLQEIAGSEPEGANSR